MQDYMFRWLDGRRPDEAQPKAVVHLKAQVIRDVW